MCGSPVMETRALMSSSFSSAYNSNYEFAHCMALPLLCPSFSLSDQQWMRRYCCCRFFVYDLCILISCSACTAVRSDHIDAQQNCKSPLNDCNAMWCRCVRCNVGRYDVWLWRSRQICMETVCIRQNATGNPRDRVGSSSCWIRTKWNRVSYTRTTPYVGAKKTISAKANKRQMDGW